MRPSRLSISTIQMIDGDASIAGRMAHVTRTPYAECNPHRVAPFLMLTLKPYESRVVPSHTPEVPPCSRSTQKLPHFCHPPSRKKPSHYSTAPTTTIPGYPCTSCFLSERPRPPLSTATTTMGSIRKHCRLRLAPTPRLSIPHGFARHPPSELPCLLIRCLDCTAHAAYSEHPPRPNAVAY